MYVITVIPIARGIGKENLSYFTGTKVELGSLVCVPLRKKMIDALVVKSVSAREMRAEIKSADFALRKIDRLVSRPFLPKAFMETVEETARWHAATVGATLNVMLPKKVLHDGHLRTWASYNTCEDAHHAIIVPTKEKKTYFKKFYKDKGVVLLPSELIDIPRKISHITIEDANSSSYKSIGRPFIDFRFAIERYAEKIGAEVIRKTEILDPEVIKIIEENKKEDDRPFTSIGRDLEKELKKPQHLFILATRRGHSGTVLCQDCGLAVKCERCDAPLTLHMRDQTKKEKEEFNNLVCHHCGFKTSALTKCSGCGSWRLKAFGVGIEKIEEDVKKFIKKHDIKTYIQRIDSTLKLTPKKIRDFISTHYEKTNSVLIATEIALPYLKEATDIGHANDASYIASLDTLLSLPDFSINEKIWRLCCLLDLVTRNKVVIQTRNPKNALLNAWKENDEKGFWEKEMSERKAFNYPPHGVFIKITLKGKKERIAIEMREIEQRIARWKPMIFPAFIKTINNQHILHALVTLPKDKWVDEELLEILLSLSPSVQVEVNPRSLL